MFYNRIMSKSSSAEYELTGLEDKDFKDEEQDRSPTLDSVAPKAISILVFYDFRCIISSSLFNRYTV